MRKIQGIQIFDQSDQYEVTSVNSDETYIEFDSNRPGWNICWGKYDYWITVHIPTWNDTITTTEQKENALIITLEIATRLQNKSFQLKAAAHGRNKNNPGTLHK